MAFYAPRVVSGYTRNENGMLADAVGMGSGGDLGDLDYTFRDSKIAGGAAAKIIWTRSPGDVSNDVGRLARRTDKAIKQAVKWGAAMGPSRASEVAFARWEVHEKMAATQFVGRTQNRGSQYGFNLAYGPGVEARGFQYGFALEARGNARVGRYGHETEVIGFILPILGAETMAQAIRAIH